MKKYNILAALLGGLLAGTSQTASADMEDWYTYWALGFSDHTYPEPLDTLVDLTDSLPGVSRSQVAIDILGFYWPVKDQKTIAGFVISGSGDRLEANGDYVQINQNLYGGSVMHYFGQEVGDGFFLRGDLGFAKASVSNNYGYSATSDTGSGLLLGVGYAIPVSAESRILFTLTTSTNNIEGDTYSTTAFRVGGLW
jgi:hypothetical protein